MRWLAGVGLLIIPTLANAAPCSVGEEQVHSFDSGARWEFCWNIAPDVGLGLTDIYFTAAGGERRQLMRSASLAELHLTMNDGSGNQSMIHATGIGSRLASLSADRCPGGSVLSSGGRSATCLQRRARGYSTKSYSTVYMGEEVLLSATFNVPSGDFVQRWSFRDDGVFEARMGHIGNTSLRTSSGGYGWPVTGGSPANVLGVTANYVWRFDLDIGSNGNDDAVETLEVRPAESRFRKELSIVRNTVEFAARFSPDVKRSWRVLDPGVTNREGHPVSYHLEPVENGRQFSDPSRQTWSASDVYVTRYRECERLAANNTGSCASNLNQFVNGESIDRADVVLWYRSSFHRQPRSDDRSNSRLRWAGMALVPRDWAAQAEY